MNAEYIQDLEAKNLELTHAIAALELRLKNLANPQSPPMFPVARLVMPSHVESL